MGIALAAALGAPFVDADDLHSDDAREKMARNHDGAVAGMPVLELAEFGVGGCHGS